MATKKDEIVKPATGPTGIQVYDYGDDAGEGFEHQSGADSSFPFIVQLQALSPICKDGDGKPGMWFNTVTEQMFGRDEGFVFVPATTRHYFAEWTPRTEGGGFHGHHDIDDPIVEQAIKESTKFGSYRRTVTETDKDGKLVEKVRELRETFYVYGVLCDADLVPETMAVIAFWSTKIRAYKAWNSRMKQLMIANPAWTQDSDKPKRIRPPLYAHAARVMSKERRNAKGEFYVPLIKSWDPRGTIQSLLDPTHDAYIMAKACRELIDSGDANVNYDKQDAQGGDDGNEMEEEGGNKKKGGAPF